MIAILEITFFNVLYEKCNIMIKITLKFIPKGTISDLSVSVQIMAWCPRESPAEKMYVPKGHAAQIFMCLYAFLCAFLIKSIKVNKSLHI